MSPYTIVLLDELFEAPMLGLGLWVPTATPVKLRLPGLQYQRSGTAGRLGGRIVVVSARERQVRRGETHSQEKRDKIKNGK